MAERRMFAKTIVLSDAFLDLPMSSRCLYFTLGMLADDDGFVNSPKSIMRQCGASQDDLNVLCAKKFIIPFESGVVVIKHWRINNYLRSDRYVETKYTEEKKSLTADETGIYHTQNVVGIPMVDQRCTQVSIGKNSIDKDSIPPSIEQVTEYCKERRNGVDPNRFIDYYEARGWVLNNRRKMVDWKAAVRTWEKGNQKDNGRKGLSHGTDYNALVMEEMFGDDL